MEARVMSQENLNQVLCLGHTEGFFEGHTCMEGMRGQRETAVAIFRYVDTILKEVPWFSQS